MRPEKFTIKLREALNSAMEAASKNENPEITCEHLLAALLAQSDGLTRPLCEKLGVSIPALEGRLRDAIAALARVRLAVSDGCAGRGRSLSWSTRCSWPATW